MLCQIPRPPKDPEWQIIVFISRDCIVAQQQEQLTSSLNQHLILSKTPLAWNAMGTVNSYSHGQRKFRSVGMVKVAKILSVSNGPESAPKESQRSEDTGSIPAGSRVQPKKRIHW